jgi:hypothetical protein
MGLAILRIMKIFIFIIIGILSGMGLHAQQSQDSVMITIFLKHQEDKNLDSIQVIQKKNHFDELFPPKSARVVSWYVMMGIGQVVTLKIPASELRTLNMSIEKGAWGVFNTEFYPTYDYMPVWKSMQK